MIRAKYVLAFMAVVCSTAALAQGRQSSSFMLRKITGEAMIEQHKQFWREEIQYEERLAAHIEQQERPLPAQARTARPEPEYYGFVHELARGYRLIFTQYRSGHTCNGDGSCQLKVIFQSQRGAPKIVVQNLTADMRSLPVVLTPNRNPAVRLASFGIGPVRWNYDAAANTYRRAPANEGIIARAPSGGQRQASVFSAPGVRMASAFRAIGERVPSSAGTAYAQTGQTAGRNNPPENCRLRPIDYAFYGSFRVAPNPNFGKNVTQMGSRFSDSTAYLAPEGTAVPAIADGTVMEVGNDPLASGRFLVVRNNDGRIVTYMNIGGNVRVSKGDAVRRGQAVGAVGPAAGEVSQPHVRLRISNANGFSMRPEAYAKECIDNAMIRAKQIPMFGGRL